MNILYHHRTQGAGAEGTHIREVVKALRALGHNVDIVSPPGVDPFCLAKEGSEKKKKKNIFKKVVLSLPQIIFEVMEIGYNFYALSKIKKVFQTKKIDFIYERYSFFGWACSVIAKKNKVPIVLEVNEVSGLKRQRPQAMVNICSKIEKKIFQRVDAIIVVSQYLKDKIVESGISIRKIHVISNAVNIKDFDVENDVTDVKAKYGHNDKVKLMFVGMFSHWDKLEFLLDVFKDVYDKRRNSHLFVVGDGVQRVHLQEQAQRLGIEEQVTFTGEVNKQDIPKLILFSDICLLSDSNPFGSPMTLFEYMALGKPVVVPSYGPIECIVEHSKQGYLFEPGNAEQFSQGLIALIDDEKKRYDYGICSREKIIEKYLWKHNAKKIVDIYEEINKSRNP